MSNPPLAAWEEDLDSVIQELYALQVESTDEDSSDTRINTGKSRRKKLDAVSNYQGVVMLMFS